MSSYFFIAAVVVLGALLALLVSRRRSRALGTSLTLKLLSIKVPRREPSHEKDFLRDIARTEQLFSALASLRAPFVFEAAVHNTGEDIYFYLAVPENHVEFARQQIQGLYLDAAVAPVTDYTIFHAHGAAAAGYLKQGRTSIIPIRTYKESEIDTFAPVLSTFARLAEAGEGAALQIVATPAAPAVAKKITKSIESLQRGESLAAIVQKDSLDLAGLARELVAGEKKAEGAPAPVVDEAAITTLRSKSASPLFAVNVRLIAAAETAERADDILLGLGSSFTQFAAPTRNSLKIIKPRQKTALIADYVFRRFSRSHAMVLNTEELASLYHIPTFSTAVPRIKWLAAKEAPPPEHLPTTGIIVGESVFRGDTKTVRLTAADRRRHLYLIGQTGTGKSHLLQTLAVQDIEAGQGCCVIDPHGDLVDNILSLVPPERIDDVIVFDPGDLTRPLGLNILEYDTARPEQKTFIVNEVIGILDRLYDLRATGGPMFEQFMRNALLLLMEDAATDPATLMELPRVFTDAAYREAKLARINNPTVVDFWRKEATKTTGEQSLANMAPYVTSKFSGFIANDYVRPIIGQTTSAFNIRRVMDDGKILLVNLAKGRIGDLNAALLGMIITGRLLMAALSRTDIPDDARRDFYLYIDEFQNFTTDSISVILSEARKYKLNLTLAHQFIAQLPEKTRDSVFGNVGSLVAFRVGSQDAEFLEKQFAPEFSARDLIAIENYQAFTRLLIDGYPSRPFTLRTLKAPGGSPVVRDKLKELSRLSYGRDISEIEADIYRRLRN